MSIGNALSAALDGCMALHKASRAQAQGDSRAAAQNGAEATHKLGQALRQLGEAESPPPTWSETVPDARYIAVHSGQNDRCLFLRQVGSAMWQRIGGSYGHTRKYTREQLDECARRSGWRFCPVELPPPPATEWQDDDEPWEG